MANISFFLNEIKNRTFRANYRTIIIRVRVIKRHSIVTHENCFFFLYDVLWSFTRLWNTYTHESGHLLLYIARFRIYSGYMIYTHTHSLLYKNPAPCTVNILYVVSNPSWRYELHSIKWLKSFLKSYHWTMVNSALDIISFNKFRFGFLMCHLKTDFWLKTDIETK